VIAAAIQRAEVMVEAMNKVIEQHREGAICHDEFTDYNVVVPRPQRSPLCMLLWKTGKTSASHSITVNNPTACIGGPRAFAAETLH
jgi:hypothetical protein